MPIITCVKLLLSNNKHLEQENSNQIRRSEEDFFLSYQASLFFFNCLPLEKGVAQHLIKLDQGCSVPSLVETGPVVLLSRKITNVSDVMLGKACHI